MNIQDLLGHSVQEIACGTAHKDGITTCLVCNEAFDDGAVYECGGRLFEGRRAALEHVKTEHGPLFNYLLGALREPAGVTAHQAEVLAMMAAGISDRAIAETISGTSNTSAVRNLRFQLKERERQAKAYLALMEAFRADRAAHAGAAGADPALQRTGSSLADERFAVTESERAAVLKAYFTPDGVLKEFPVREKRKIVALNEIAKRFEPGRTYTEKEVNGIIAYHDFATVRRYLVEYGLLERSQDCSRYWRKEQ